MDDLILIGPTRKTGRPSSLKFRVAALGSSEPRMAYKEASALSNSDTRVTPSTWREAIWFFLLYWLAWS